ncbi:hypothetical protein Tco_1491366 [Tanacetum coccineum]
MRPNVRPVTHGSKKSWNKKYRGLNSSEGGNIGDGVKIAGGVIGSGGGIVEKAFSISNSDEVIVERGDEDMTVTIQYNISSDTKSVTPPFLQIAAEANLGYYFKGGLEGDEEGLVDVFFKLESSYGEVFGPCDAVAMKGRKRKPCANFYIKDEEDI